ncbi:MULTISPECIES: thermonuclease family protein [Paracoccaceae]|uniref:thermonuclease family protein n=1 Tax=Paracoccaceae TaxID=31989 RepID=UPI0032984BDA
MLLVLLGLWLYNPDAFTDATARVQTTATETVNPRSLSVVDGDTVRRAGETIRLVGYDTPETYRAECDSERARGDEATARLRELIGSENSVDLTILPGRDRHGRLLGRLSVGGDDVGDILISEGLARAYRGGQRDDWC